VASCTVLASVATTSGGTVNAPTAATQPRLSLDRLIRTSPFVGSTTTAGDNEDVVYVAPDDAFWIADDNADAIYKVDRRTGALLTTIPQSSFMAAPERVLGALAPADRSEDLEALAYDADDDVLYAFSGSTNALATVYRLVRDAGHKFRIASWRSLPSEWTGAAWRPADRKLYVANGSEFDTFDYETNRFGPVFSVPGLDKVTGIGFDPSNGDLIAVNQRLFRIAMDAHAIRPGWKARSLKRLGIEDSRGIAVVDHQMFVSEGSDARTPGDPRNHGIFVIDVTNGGNHRHHAPNHTSTTTSPTRATGPPDDHTAADGPGARQTARRGGSRGKESRRARTDSPRRTATDDPAAAPVPTVPSQPVGHVAPEHAEKSNHDGEPRAAPAQKHLERSTPASRDPEPRTARESKEPSGRPDWSKP